MFGYAFTGPSALTVNIIKNIESSSIFVQCDAVDDSLTTRYTVTWTRAGGSLQVASLIEQTSYTITGLTLDTVYTITVTAANDFGHGPESSTRVKLSTNTTSFTSSISPTVTASNNYNPMTTTTALTTTLTNSSVYVLRILLH